MIILLKRQKQILRRLKLIIKNNPNNQDIMIKMVLKLV